MLLRLLTMLCKTGGFYDKTLPKLGFSLTHCKKSVILRLGNKKLKPLAEA